MASKSQAEEVQIASSIDFDASHEIACDRPSGLSALVRGRSIISARHAKQLWCLVDKVCLFIAPTVR